MKKYLVFSLTLALALAMGAGTVSAKGPGGSSDQGNGGPGGGNSFGSYVSTLTDANIPYAMDQLDLDFGKIFVKPYTPSTEMEPEIVDIFYNKDQWWVVGSEADYAVQWYTQHKDKTSHGVTREAGHDYLIVWTGDMLGSSCDDYYWRSYNFGSNKPFPITGTYYAYIFDVTNVG